MIETQIEKAIKTFIFSKGGFIQKTHSGAIQKAYKARGGRWRTHVVHLADAGTPDMMGVLNGYFLGIEVKKDEKEVQKWLKYPLGLRGKPVKRDPRIEAQKHFAEKIKKAGGIFAIVSSVDELEEDLKKVGVIT